MYYGVALREPIEYTCHKRGACSRAACHCLAAATLPHAHSQFGGIYYFDKLDVCPVRPYDMVFEFRAKNFYGGIIGRIDQYDSMRISH